MLIDFHTHVFPPAIAQRALDGIVQRTKEIYGIDQDKSFDGTVDGLKEQMKRTGVDISVILPIATKVTQYKTINCYAEEITCGSIISFASLHPYQENVYETLDQIKAKGFKGIKLHPDYQGVYIDDEASISLIKRATEMGLYVAIHSGEDLGKPSPFHCTIDRLRKVLDKVEEKHIILAHMGGFNLWDDVESMIINSKAYFDTSVVSRYMDIDQYRRIIEKHGADRILFGSDTPWEDPSDSLAFLHSAGLSGDELELITHINAEQILFGKQ